MVGDNVRLNDKMDSMLKGKVEYMAEVAVVSEEVVTSRIRSNDDMSVWHGRDRINKSIIPGDLLLLCQLGSSKSKDLNLDQGVANSNYLLQTQITRVNSHNANYDDSRLSPEVTSYTRHVF